MDHDPGGVEHAPQRGLEPLARPRDEVHVGRIPGQHLRAPLGQLGPRHRRRQPVDRRQLAQSLAHARGRGLGHGFGCYDPRRALSSARRLACRAAPTASPRGRERGASRRAVVRSRAPSVHESARCFATPRGRRLSVERSVLRATVELLRLRAASRHSAAAGSPRQPGRRDRRSLSFPRCGSRRRAAPQRARGRLSARTPRRARPSAPAAARRRTSGPPRSESPPCRPPSASPARPASISAPPATVPARRRPRQAIDQAARRRQRLGRAGGAAGGARRGRARRADPDGAPSRSSRPARRPRPRAPGGVRGRRRR